MADKFLQASIEEAQLGLREGGRLAAAVLRRVLVAAQLWRLTLFESRCSLKRFFK